VRTKFAITFDVDWAPEAVIQDTLDILRRRNIKAVFFATHDSAAIHAAASDGHEIGIHPNLQPLLRGEGGDFRKIVGDLRSIYPQAIGIRTHGLVSSSNLLLEFAGMGLQYDSNIFLPGQEVLPFRMQNGFLRIPFHFEDDVHFSFGRSFDFSADDFSANSFVVFNFHPVHVFLNTEKEETYNKAKQYYQDAGNLRNFRNESGAPGTRDYLEQLLDHISSHAVPHVLLRDLLNS
jgi:hypothetical protein